jgi:hypothetical protein
MQPAGGKKMYKKFKKVFPLRDNHYINFSYEGNLSVNENSVSGCRAPVLTDSVSAVYRAPKKFKIKEINGS